jgi:glycosyltransferase involved in cell wall biosynthesis
VLILPSRFEPWGLVINEAMASGNAIIASNKVGAGYDLIANKNGRIFESENVKDLENKIIYFIRNKKNINLFQQNSLLRIKKFSFMQCLIGINKALTKIKNN